MTDLKLNDRVRVYGVGARIIQVFERAGYCYVAIDGAREHLYCLTPLSALRK